MREVSLPSTSYTWVVTVPAMSVAETVRPSRSTVVVAVTCEPDATGAASPWVTVTDCVSGLPPAASTTVVLSRSAPVWSYVADACNAPPSV